MGKGSGLGMSGNLSTPRTRALEDWKERKSRKDDEAFAHHMDIQMTIQRAQQPGESWQQTIDRLLQEGVLHRI